MANAFPIAEGELEINADPSAALRNVQEFLRRVNQRLRRGEDEAEASGRRTGRRYGDGLNEGLRGGNLINDLLNLRGPSGGGGEGEGGGGGGGGFVQGLISGLRSGFRRILDEIRTLISDIESLLSGLGGGGGGGFLSDLQDAFTDLFNGIRSGVIATMRFLHNTWTRTLGALGGASLTGLWTRFTAWIRVIWTRFSAWASASFGALWTRIRSFGASMNSAVRTVWTRFTTWAIASFRLVSAFASAFWARMRGWARYHWTTFSVIGRWVWGQVSAWARGAFTRIRGWFSRVWSGMSSRGRSIWTRVAGWARSAVTAIGGWFSSLFTAISGWASTAFAQLKTAFEGIGKAAGAAGPFLQAGLFAALIPLVLGLGGALAQLLPLLLLLPAAIATLVSIIAPAIVAFKGFGEAVGAGLSGDVEKFNEALKKLTPNARAVAKEFVKLGPMLKEIKARTQDALFEPLRGTIAPLAKTLLPALSNGMAVAGKALGRLLAGFAKMLATPEVISAINALFATTERILDKLGPPLANLFGALFGTVEGGLPWIERLVDTIAEGINKFANWLREIKQTGQMQSWLTQAWEAAKKFWDLLVSLGELVGSLFGAGGNEGLTWIENLTAAVQRLTAYFKSAEGIEFLENLVSWMDEGGDLMKTGIDLLTGLFKIISKLINIAQATPGFFRDLWKSIKDVAAAIGGFFSMIGRVSWNWIKDAAKAVGDFFVGVGEWIVDAYHTVVGWGGAILDWFSKIPGWIGQFFSNIPGWIADGLAALRDAIFYGIGWVIGSIIKVIMSIPGWLASAWEWIRSSTVSGAKALWAEVSSWPGRARNALSSFGSTVLGIFDSAWDTAYESTVRGLSAAGEWVSELPGRVGNWLSSLPGTVSRWFTDTWNRGREKTSQGISDTVSEVGKLRDKALNALSGAGSWLYDVGRDMIRGLINGISSMWGWAVDQAKAAANAIKKGFLDALDSHSPSRVMQKEVGRTILPGVVEGIKDTIPETQRYLGTMANMMINGFQPTVNVAAPNVHTGDVMLQADFGEGIRQAVPLVITRIPRVVAGAAAVGKRERGGWVNTGRAAG